MINLLPPEIKSERKYGRLNKVVFVYCLAAILVGISSIVIVLFNSQLLSADVSRINDEISKANEQAAKLEKSQKSVEAVATQLEAIETLLQGEIKFSELIPNIAAMFPNGVILNNLTLKGGSLEPLQLNVDLKQQELVSVLQQNLINSDLFEAADIISVTSKGEEAQGAYPYQASLSVTFTGTAEKKKKEEAKKKAEAEQAANGGDKQ